MGPDGLVLSTRPGIGACLRKDEGSALARRSNGGFAFYVAGLYRTTPPHGTEPKIDLAFGGGPSMHRPTSPVASNPERSHPLNVAGFSPPIPDTAPAIVFHCT